MKSVSALFVVIALVIGLVAGGVFGFLLSPPPVTITRTEVVERTVSTTLTTTSLSTLTVRTTQTVTWSTTKTVTTIQFFKPLDSKSVIMLIGDLDDRGPNPSIEERLMRRIDVASETGVDTVMIVFRTSSVETTFTHLDKLINYAGKKGLGVIPRIVVESRKFTERIHGDPQFPDWDLPDFTNNTQLIVGLDLLRQVVSHLENFSNIVGYQVEWGHYGESWINAVFWNSESANRSFRNFLSRVAPKLLEFDFAWWVSRKVPEGDIIYYSRYLPPSDPRSRPENVALFYWYQEWRNQITLNITWSFRCLVKQLTTKPVIGFSYVGVLDVTYVYSADRCLDVAFSAFTPHPTFKPTMFYVRDGYFQGLQLAELDFDSPYIAMESVEEVIADAYSKGIVPVIFYPLWSQKLSDKDIPRLVNYMKRYVNEFGTKRKSQILMVTGGIDVGHLGYTGCPPTAVANWFSVDPPGFIRFLENNNISYDMMDARVYEPRFGDGYKAVVVFTPRDMIDGDLLDRLSRTNTAVFIMFPSFIIGTPSRERPYDVSAGLFGMWNELNLKGRKIRLHVTGSPPAYKINFEDELYHFGIIADYYANHIFSFFEAPFDQVLARVEIDNTYYPVIGRIANIYFIGLDLHVSNSKHQKMIFNALKTLFEKIDI